MKIEYDREVRGIMVTITCTDFDGDPSVGIEYGPETVSAVDKLGNDFQLTEDEVTQFSTEASQDAFDNECDDDE